MTATVESPVITTPSCLIEDFSQLAQSPDLSLVDLSLLPRWGVRGPGSREYLAGLKRVCPDLPNKACINNDALVLRLSKSEYWCLNSEPTFNQASSLNSELLKLGVYSLPTWDSYAWFCLKSEKSAYILAKLCGVDLSTGVFKSGDVVQTSVARVNAILCKHEYKQSSLISILSDRASAQYLWEALEDAIANP